MQPLGQALFVLRRVEVRIDLLPALLLAFTLLGGDVQVRGSYAFDEGLNLGLGARPLFRRQTSSTRRKSGRLEAIEVLRSSRRLCRHPAGRGNHRRSRSKPPIVSWKLPLEDQRDAILNEVCSPVFDSHQVVMQHQSRVTIDGRKAGEEPLDVLQFSLRGLHLLRPFG